MDLCQASIGKQTGASVGKYFSFLTNGSEKLAE